jgi:hypothetical protein
MGGDFPLGSNGHRLGNSGPCRLWTPSLRSGLSGASNERAALAIIFLLPRMSGVEPSDEGDTISRNFLVFIAFITTAQET